MGEHREPCDVNDATFCMNGGTCYKISSMDTLSCVCIERYKGNRCEELHLDFIHGNNEMDAGLIAAVTIIVLLILVVLAFIIYYVTKFMKSNNSDTSKKQRSRKTNI